MGRGTYTLVQDGLVLRYRIVSKNPYTGRLASIQLQDGRRVVCREEPQLCKRLVAEHKVEEQVVLKLVTVWG